MNKNRDVAFAGISIVTDIDGGRKANFHVSNKPKYAVWCQLPTHEGEAKTVQFQWFKMMPGTNLKGAVDVLLTKIKDEFVRERLLEIAHSFEPKIRKPRAKKGEKAKASVQVSDKMLTNDEAKAKKDAIVAAILAKRRK